MKQPDYVRAILEGDRLGLQYLYADLLPFIRHLVVDYGGSEADAKDVFQDAVLIIYQKARQPGFHLTCEFRTFICGVCRNLWLNRRTKKSATAEVLLSSDLEYIAGDISIETDLLYLERDRIFWHAFHRLDSDCRRVLELYFQKTPMERIAECMGYRSGAYARRRKMQCKERLIGLIQSSPDFPDLL